MRFRPLFCSLLLLLCYAAGCAEPAAVRALTPEEAEFVALMEAQSAAEAARSEAAPKLARSGSANWDAFFAWQAEQPLLMPEDEAMLAFEVRHRGERVGLLALRHLVLSAGRTLVADHRLWRGRHAALQAMTAYAADPLLAEIMQRLASGGFDAEIPRTLARVRDMENATDGNRLAASLAIGRWHLHIAEMRAAFERKAAEAEASTDPEERAWLHRHRKILSELPLPEAMSNFRDVGLQELQAVAASGSTEAPPATRFIRDRWPEWHVLEIDPAGESPPTLAETAAGLLFAERALKEGSVFPPLETPTLGGGSWSAWEHRGDVLLIHFGFRACPPCRALTSTLRAIHDAHPDDVSLLAVRVDEEAADAEHARDSGEIPWPIHHDLGRKLAAAWGIVGYPTVIVVGRDGLILSVDVPRGEELEALIERAVRLD